MLVKLVKVGGPLDQPLEEVHINPRHVVKVERGSNASDPDRQKFVTELTLVIGPVVRVEGAPSQVLKDLNGGGR